MLSKDEQKKLLKFLNYSDEDIAGMVDGDDEKEVALPDAKVYTKKELDDIKNAHVNSKKQGFYDAGKEFAVKEIKELAGLEFEGKDYQALLEAYKKHVLADANINPTEAKKRYEDEKKALQDKLIAEQNKAADLQKQIQDITFERQLLASFPKGETILPAEDIIALAKNKLAAKTDNDTTIFSYKGAELKDDKENYLDLSASVAHMFEKEGWLKQGDGQDGTPPKKKGLGLGDSPSFTPGNYKTFADFEADLEASGVLVGSDEANKRLQAAIAKNPKLLDTAGAA